MLNLVLFASFFEERVDDAYLSTMMSPPTVRGVPSQSLYNPAAIAGATPFGGFVYYTLPFGIFNLVNAGAGLHFKLAWGDYLAFSYRHYQYFDPDLLYLEASPRATYVWVLAGGKYSLSGSLGIDALSISSNSVSGLWIAPSVDMGFLAHISEGFYLGGYVKRINMPVMGESGSPLPTTMSIGIGFVPNPSLAVHSGIKWEHPYLPGFYFSQEWKIANLLRLRAGVLSYPFRLSLGAGFNFGAISVSTGWALQSNGYLLLLSLSSSTSMLKEKPRWRKPVYKEEIVKIDLNSAKIGDLLSIPGMTYSLAYRIVSYRESAGGFKSWDDLKKIPGLPSYMIERIKKYAEIKTGTGKINMNTADKRVLIEKLGFSPLEAQKIIRARDELGSFKSISDLYNIPGIDPAKIDAIKDKVEF